MATKIKVLASQWRQGNVTPNGTEIELTDEQGGLNKLSVGMRIGKGTLTVTVEISDVEE